MVADFMTNPLQGGHFRNLRDYIMGRVGYIKPEADVISLGRKASNKHIQKSKATGSKGRV